MVIHLSGSSPFIGRQDELAHIVHLLADPNCRLLSLVGPGGIGKTRLALEAAGQFTEAHFVLLQPLSSPDFIVSAIADAIGFQFYSDSEPKQQLLDYLREKAWLLLLDNFEHLLDGASLLSEILATASNLRLLVTSRERLNLVEEWVLEVGGLAYPLNRHEADAERYSAVELFVQHARRVKSSFRLTDVNHSAVIHICRLVGGMPLGIELAASWVRALPCDAIADEIDRSLDILETPAHNIEPRHRTMRAALAPTWERLSDEERDVFIRLSVFRGGFTRESAKEVAHASLRTLTALVDKSLLRVDATGRHDMHELLRQFAEEKLEAAGETLTTAHKHFDYFVALAELADTHLYDLDSVLWMDRLELEHDNLRVALGWSLRDKQVELGLRLTQALWFFWEQRGYIFEASTWSEQLLMLTTDAPAKLRATALQLAGSSANYFGDHDRARMLLEEGLNLAREVGDKEMIAWTLGELGFGVETLSNLNRAVELLEEQLSLSREINYAQGIGHALRGLGTVLTNQGDYERARLLLDEALALAHHVSDKLNIAWVTDLFGNLIWSQTKDAHRAIALYQESLTLGRELRNELIAKDVGFMMGQVARFQKDYDRAQAYLEESLAIVRVRGWGNVFTAHMLGGFAGLICVRGFPEQAAQLYGATDVYLRHLIGQDFPFGKPMNYDEDVKTACTQLGEEQFAALFAKGQAMTLRQAVAYALEVRTLSSAQASDVFAKIDQQPAFLSPIDPLSERELEILRLLAEGLTNQQIAEKLIIVLGTVKAHNNNIFSKLGVANRVQAIVRAREYHLI